MTDRTRAVLAHIESAQRTCESRERHGLPYEGFEQPILAGLHRRYLPGGRQYKTTGTSR